MKTSTLSTLALASLSALGSAAPETWTISLVGVSNTASPGTGIHPLAYATSDGSLSSVSASASFTGNNRDMVEKTMSFSGTTTGSAEFGRLRSRTSGVLTNSYYNLGNAVYVRPNGTIHPTGSPDSLSSLGFAGFNDTLQFGGVLQAGYKARYIFHVDGTTTGAGGRGADMVVKIADDADESFFAFGVGTTSTNWATTDHEVNGIDPESIRVQFATNIVFDTFSLPDGGDYSGVSDFSSTLTLDAIEMRDAGGNLVDGWTVTSESGTQYPQAVPEPATLAAMALGLLALRRRRR